MTKSQIEMNVDFTGVEDNLPASVTKLSPGVYDLTITGMEFGLQENEKATPYADVTVVASSGQHTDRFYLTPKALIRLKHLLLNAGVSETLLSGKVNAEQLVNASIGKKVRARLNGREYMSSKDNSIRVVAEFAFNNYAQPISEPNTLTFDASKHISRLNSTSSITSTSNAVPELKMPVSDDMPF